MLAADHSLPAIVRYPLHDDFAYHELGGDVVAVIRSRARKRYAARQREALGYRSLGEKVTIERAA